MSIDVRRGEKTPGVTTKRGFSFRPVIEVTLHLRNSAAGRRQSHRRTCQMTGMRRALFMTCLMATASMTRAFAPGAISRIPALSIRTAAQLCQARRAFSVSPLRMGPEENMAEKGIVLPEVAAAAANYVCALELFGPVLLLATLDCCAIICLMLTRPTSRFRTWSQGTTSTSPDNCRW